MSNNVGNLYQTVIEGVIRDARPDFQDMGESETTLFQLQKEWQTRLSAMNVAAFMPWDNVEDKGISSAPFINYGYDLGMPVLSGAGAGVSGSSGGPLGSGLAGVPKPNQGMYLKEEENSFDLRYGQQPSAVPSAGSAGAPQAPSPVRGLAVPGAGQSLEHPGLALPELPQNDGVVSERDLRAVIEDIMNDENSKPLASKASQKQRVLRQTDGPSEETVGSDLDDSEDDLNSDNEDDDGDQGMIMLCLYDKVQRVKNKWKYVLKDGVANINGSDYVFSRATGESEW